MKKTFKKIIVWTLTLEAKLVLMRWHPKIIAVTGSVGKTSTKDAIYAVFSKLYSARKSEKSFNSEIGVPLAILGLPNAWNNPILWIFNIIRGFFICLASFLYFPKSSKLIANSFPEYLILEIGADRPGDIKKIGAWLRPDIAVIGKIGKLPVHVEFFDSPEALAREKIELAKALKPKGIVIAYADDEQTMKMVGNLKNHNVISFGFSERADVVASNYDIVYKKWDNGKLMPSGISFKINCDGNCLPIIIEGALGRVHVYPALSAIAAVVAIKGNTVSASEALRGYQTAPGRMRLIKGVKNSLIIDDTYNSSPSALEEALQTLKNINVTNSRRVAVFGDMRELGKYSRGAHLEAGESVAKICDLIFTVGEGGKIIADGALNASFDEEKVFSFENSTEAGKEIQNMIGEGDIILIKGSQYVRMEKIVEEIMLEPERAGELLVRQEREWKKR